MIKSNFLLFLLVLFLFSSCDIKTSERSLPESVGKYGHVLVVIDSSYENSSTGKILDSILTQPVYGLPQAESIFSVNTVSHSGFRDILTRASNIINIKIAKSAQPEFIIKKDLWAKGQIVVEVSAKNKSTVNNILKVNAEHLVQLFNNEEQNRWKQQLQKLLNSSLSEDIIDSHNISILVPEGYYMMDNNQNSFWIKKEKSIGEHQVIQALMVYYYPYASENTFSIPEMIAKRDEFTYENIKGTIDSSYMKVYKEYPLSSDTLTINDMYSVEYRGLWNMENDFMGGPFLHYTVLDEKNNRIIHLDAFVFAPKFNKREYVRELEAIIKSINIPS